MPDRPARPAPPGTPAAPGRTGSTARRLAAPDRRGSPIPGPPGPPAAVGKDHDDLGRPLERMVGCEDLAPVGVDHDPRAPRLTIGLDEPGGDRRCESARAEGARGWDGERNRGPILRQRADGDDRRL